MFITIVATVACVSVVLLPAFAELRRMQDDRDNPMRLLKIPTRRGQVESTRANGKTTRLAAARSRGSREPFKAPAGADRAYPAPARRPA